MTSAACHRRVGLVALTALTLCLGPAARAHEMGASRALVTFHTDGTFTVDVLVDPQSLLTQLALRAGQTAPEPDTHDARIALVRAALPVLGEGIELHFDGVRADAALEYSTGLVPALTSGLPAGVGDAGTLHLRGTIPEGAERFSFAYRWTYGAMPLQVQDASAAAPRIHWLGPGERSPQIALAGATPPTRAAIAGEYLRLGFTHILPKGVDHILFVLGLFFLGAGGRALLLQVSTFTIAHTITLGLTMVGAVSVSPSIVEPLIALSIAYVAIENLTTAELRPSRLVLIFCFGLLHGMGFAGVLTELGLPASRFVAALLSFNVGVELGQITVLAAATAIVAGWRRRDLSLLPVVARPASMLIAAGGLFWTVERIW